MQIDIAYKKEQQSKILSRLREKNRVAKIRVAAPKECVVGQSIQGAYAKDAELPELPYKLCSRPGGCICAYEPILNDIYP